MYNIWHQVYTALGDQIKKEWTSVKCIKKKITYANNSNDLLCKKIYIYFPYHFFIVRVL